MAVEAGPDDPGDGARAGTPVEEGRDVRFGRGRRDQVGLLWWIVLLQLAAPGTLPADPFFLLIALFCASASSQETTLRSQTNLVLLPTLVKDSQGQVIYGLEAKDFIVEDDRVLADRTVIGMMDA